MNRLQTIVLVGIALVLMTAGFQAGRYTIATTTPLPGSNVAPTERRLTPRLPRSLYADDDRHVIIRNIAGIPFPEVYDILRAASPEQIFAWARELEQLPENPQRRAALVAFYKTLIQVDVSLATQAVIRTKDMRVREIAIYAMRRAAPESAWGEMAAMQLKIPHRQGRAHLSEILADWSKVDPHATSQFIEEHWEETGKGYFHTLLSSWGNIDPAGAVAWMLEKPGRQTSGAIAGLLTGWAKRDRAGALHYALANATHDDFRSGIIDLADDTFRVAPDDARQFVQSLPPNTGRLAIEEIGEWATGIFVGQGAKYQLSPEPVAKWMITLPESLWQDELGNVILAWNRSRPDAADSWLDGLPTDVRDQAIADVCAFGDTENPLTSIAFAQRIRDPDVREKALTKFVSRLVSAGPDGLRALKKLDLPLPEKKHLLKVASEASNEP